MSGILPIFESNNLIMIKRFFLATYQRLKFAFGVMFAATVIAMLGLFVSPTKGLDFLYRIFETTKDNLGE